MASASAAETENRCSCAGCIRCTLWPARGPGCHQQQGKHEWCQQRPLCHYCAKLRDQKAAAAEAGLSAADAAAAIRKEEDALKCQCPGCTTCLLWPARGPGCHKARAKHERGMTRPLCDSCAKRRDDQGAPAQASHAGAGAGDVAAAAAPPPHPEGNDAAYCQCTGCPTCTRRPADGPGCHQFRARHEWWQERPLCKWCAKARDSAGQSGQAGSNSKKTFRI